jgi:hypothetical protein
MASALLVKHRDNFTLSFIIIIYGLFYDSASIGLRSVEFQDAW